MSARGTIQPPPAVTVPVSAPARKVTPDPDVVVNLSADIAGPGWSFENVPKNDEAQAMSMVYSSGRKSPVNGVVY